MVTIEVLLISVASMLLPDEPWIEDAMSGTAIISGIVYIYCAGLIGWALIRSVMQDE